MAISKKWLAMAEIYKRFAKEYPQADFSDEAALAMYNHETHGIPLTRTEKLNGFELGKKWMDVTVAGWKEEIASRGLLVSELIEDGYSEWFLKRVGVLHLRAEWSKCEWWMKVSNVQIHPTAEAGEARCSRSGGMQSWASAFISAFHIATIHML